MVIKRDYKKSQSAIEFAVIFGFILFFFIAFFAVIQLNQSEKNKEKEKLIIQNVALDVQDEINLAAQSSDGYYREFNVPLNIFGREYNITLIDGMVYVNTSDFGVSYNIFEVNGTLTKGTNRIRKENGAVYLNTNP